VSGQAVRGRTFKGGTIVVAVDAEELAAADGDLRDVRHEVVGRSLRVLPDLPARVRAHGVEVAQRDDLPRAVRLVHVVQDLLDKELCAGVRVGPARGRGLADGQLLGVAVDRGRRREHNVLAAVLGHDLEQVQRPGDVVVVVPFATKDVHR